MPVWPLAAMVSPTANEEATRLRVQIDRVPAPGGVALLEHTRRWAKRRHRGGRRQPCSRRQGVDRGPFHTRRENNGPATRSRRRVHDGAPDSAGVQIDARMEPAGPGFGEAGGKDLGLVEGPLVGLAFTGQDAAPEEKRRHGESDPSAELGCAGSGSSASSRDSCFSNSGRVANCFSRSR